MKVWLETTSKPANKVVEKQQTDKHVDLTTMQSPLMVKVTESSDLQMPTQTWHIYYKHIIFQYLSFLFLNFKAQGTFIKATSYYTCTSERQTMSQLKVLPSIYNGISILSHLHNRNKQKRLLPVPNFSQDS